MLAKLLLFLTLAGASALAKKTKETTVDCAVVGKDVESMMATDNVMMETMMGFEADPKTYVDRALKKSTTATCDQYNLLDHTDEDAMIAFRDEYYWEADDTLNLVEPPDAPDASDLTFYEEQTETNKATLTTLMELWTLLYREVNTTVWSAESSTLMEMPSPLMVPGGRFVEAYYWDTYWIVRGMLFSGMNASVKGMLENYLQRFETGDIGFIPNGFRMYYRDRSQPPYISEMLRAYYEFSGDKAFVTASVDALIQEHDLFASVTTEPGNDDWVGDAEDVRYFEDGYVVHLKFPDDTTGTLSRFYQTNTAPRVESLVQDLETLELATRDEDLVQTGIRAGAESGWDFSARWIIPVEEGSTTYLLEDIMTMDFLPADLNSLLYRLEVNIANFMIMRDGESGKDDAVAWFEKAAARAEVMKKVMLDSTTGRWADYQFKDVKMSDINIAAGFWPAWSGMLTQAEMNKAFDWLLSEDAGLEGDCGISASNQNTGQQWDYPNMWAPLTHTAVEALITPLHHSTWASPTDYDWVAENEYIPYRGEVGLPPKHDYDSTNTYHQKALKFASNWVESMSNGFLPGQTEGYWEKYSVNIPAGATRCGAAGDGGEYETPTGFGWTNGAAVDFLYNFGAHMEEPPYEGAASSVGVSVTAIAVALAVAIASSFM